MRVVVDASAAFNQGAGIGRYARNLLPALARALPDADFCLVYAPARPGPSPHEAPLRAAFPEPGRVTVRRLPLSRRRADQLWFRARLPLPIQAVAGRADVVYSPDFTAPPAGRAPRLMTVHDLAFLVRPELAPPALRRYLAGVVPRQVAAAARVLVVSEATRRDVEERLGVPPERIALVANGVEERFFRAEPLGRPVRAELGLPAAYLLAVGTIEPRKNLEGLFEALRRGPDLDLPLVVAGGCGWQGKRIVTSARDLVAGGRVRFLGYVSEDRLPGLYAGAAAVVYLSWYEGFGLPVVEGLAAGVPVVASTAPALVEVAGGAALHADPADPDAILAAIRAALAGERVGAVEERRRAAARYRWEDAGRSLAAALLEAAGERGGRRGR